MNIAHISDLHFKPEAYEQCKASIETVIAEHERNPFALIVISGDLWHGAIMDTARAQFAAFLELIRRLADCAPVAIIYGTPSHDTEGSLEVFEQLSAAFPIRILRPGQPYYLGSRGSIMGSDGQGDEFAQLLLFGVPEPQKKWLLANAEATGKDDSDLAVREALRKLFLGLGGMRRQHTDLPCVLLYHGEIAGAKTGVGHQSEIGTGFVVTKDDLAAVSADYIACGHIHEPQEVEGLPARYAGSIYAADFGETHKPGFNVVEISPIMADETEEEFDLFLAAGSPKTGFLAKVSRVDFPHPRRIHIVCTREEFDNTHWPQKIGGYVAWVEMHDEASKLDGSQDAETKTIIETYGALPGSKVTHSIIPVETVRAGEIIEARALEDKLKVYAEASETSMPDTALAKARELERESAAAGAGAGAHIRIDRLRLRGAIGIFKKSKKDEIDIDLGTYGPGVLALVGANGFGKTTILENMHPWPCMLTRDGTLKDHFRLKDSCRDLYFTDLRSGFRYRALIQIRADIASGGAEYFLYVDKGAGTYEDIPGVNGRKEPYETAIAELFGSLEMYLQTAFVTQRPNKYAPDLGQATQGQRKALFAELSGIDYLAAYASSCKARGDDLEDAIGKLDAGIEAASDLDAQIERLTADRAEAVSSETLAEDAAAAATTQERTLGTEREALALRVAELEREHKRRDDLATEIAETDATLAAIAKEIEGFTQAAEGRGAAETELARLEALEAEGKGLRTQKAEADEAHRQALEAYQRDTAELRRRQDATRGALDSARSRLAAAEKAEDVARAKIDPDAETKLTVAREALTKAESKAKEANEAAATIKAEVETLRKKFAEARALPFILDSLHDGEACPICGSASHPAPAHADLGAVNRLEAEGKQAMNRADEVLAEASKATSEAAIAHSRLETAETAAQDAKAAQEALTGLSSETTDALFDLNAAQAALDAIGEPPAPPEALPFPGAARLQEIEAELDFGDPEGQRATIAAADAAGIRLEAARSRKAEATGRRGKLAADLAALPAQAETDLPDKLTAKDAELRAARDHLADAQRSGAAARATIEACDRGLAEAQTRLTSRAAAQKERQAKAADLADWRLLERAVGPNGIQALELDALAPSIVEVANKLLGVFSSRYQIEIRTQRVAGKGKQTKMVEDFEIYILDSETGDEQTIDSLSGGEAVWIRKALYDAFAVVRARNTDRRFLTVFLDEADGALDPEARMLYLRMLEAAHRESGRFQTIIVTHSRELQAMVERTIDVTTLGPREGASEGGMAA
jgi:exonuclease SbcC